MAGGGWHCSSDHRSSAPPAQGARGRAGGRRRLSATVRSSGDRRGGVPLAGASGRQVAGAGDEELTGEMQLEQEGRRAGSGQRKSFRGGGGSQGCKELPVWAAEASSRPKWVPQLPAVTVRSVQVSSAARERLGRLHATLRSFLNAWSGGSTIGGTDG